TQLVVVVRTVRATAVGHVDRPDPERAAGSRDRPGFDHPRRREQRLRVLIGRRRRLVGQVAGHLSQPDPGQDRHPVPPPNPGGPRVAGIARASIPPGGASGASGSGREGAGGGSARSGVTPASPTRARLAPPFTAPCRGPRPGNRAQRSLRWGTPPRRTWSPAG